MRYYTECTKCGKEVPKRDSKVQELLSENSKFGFTVLCPDCARDKR